MGLKSDLKKKSITQLTFKIICRLKCFSLNFLNNKIYFLCYRILLYFIRMCILLRPRTYRSRETLALSKIIIKNNQSKG